MNLAAWLDEMARLRVTIDELSWDDAGSIPARFHGRRHRREITFLVECARDEPHRSYYYRGFIAAHTAVAIPWRDTVASDGFGFRCGVNGHHHINWRVFAHGVAAPFREPFAANLSQFIRSAVRVLRRRQPFPWTSAPTVDDRAAIFAAQGVTLGTHSQDTACGES
jgi:hypothetical protein